MSMEETTRPFPTRACISAAVRGDLLWPMALALLTNSETATRVMYRIVAPLVWTRSIAHTPRDEILAPQRYSITSSASVSRSPVMPGTRPGMTNLESVCRAGSYPLRRRRAHEVALADLDAALPDDVVSGGGVKIKVRQAAAQQQALAGEVRDVPVRRGELDFLAVGTVDLALLDSLQKRDGFGDALFELGERRLLGSELRSFLAGQHPGAIDGVIGHSTN